MKKILFPAACLLLMLLACCASKKVFLTGGWLYHRGGLENFEQPEFDDSEWEKISLPHTLSIEPARFKPGEKYYRGVGLYRLRYSAFKDENGKSSYQPGDRVLLHFEGVLTRADVWLNGKYVGSHLGGYTPFTFDITEQFLADKENLLAVKVDNSKMNVPPEGLLVDYALFGGIYREVWAEIKDAAYLENPFAYTVELDGQKALLKISALTKNTLTAPLPCKFSASLDDKIKGKEGIENITVAELEKEFSIPVGTGKVDLELLVENPKLWSPDYPYLYDLELELLCPDLEKIPEVPPDQKRGVIKDSVSIDYGIRSIKFTEQGFFLNGRRVQLLGQNRHQSFPYLGNAAGFRLQYLDALLLKQSGANFVRLSHYPQSPDFLDACDRLGLMVFEELPGWAYVGDREWKKIAEQSLRDMILRDRNRPGVIIWGVRINEAWWGEKWLAQMIAPAHELDPSRPASGARYVGNFRNLREDVIAHNDYSGGLLKPPPGKPWFVSEYLEGLARTRPDADQIKAIRSNAYMLELIFSDPSCAGSAGWAFADYNTFITPLAAPLARNRIKFEGIVDIFRLPKPPYYFYQAQTSGAPMVKLVNQWWEKDEFPGEVMAVGNCEQVRLLLNEKEIATRGPDRTYAFPKPGEYQNLPHPPFSFSGFKFQPGALTAQCLIRGQSQAEDHLRTPGPAAKIQLEWGEEFSGIEPFYLLSDDSYSDPIRLIARLTDAQGNPVRENQARVKFIASETGEIIGENPFRMQDGVAVVMVRMLIPPELEKRFGKDLKKIELTARAEIEGRPGIPAAEISILIGQVVEDEGKFQTMKEERDQKMSAVDKLADELFDRPELGLRKLFNQKLGELQQLYMELPVLIGPEDLKILNSTTTEK